MSLAGLVEIEEKPLGVESRNHISRITYHSQEGGIKKEKVPLFSGWVGSLFKDLFTREVLTVNHEVKTVGRKADQRTKDVEEIAREYSSVPTTKLFNGNGNGMLETYYEGDNKFYSDKFSKNWNSFDRVLLAVVGNQFFNPGREIAQYHIDMALHREECIADLAKIGIALEKPSKERDGREFDRRYSERVLRGGYNAAKLKGFYTSLLATNGNAIIHGDLVAANVFYAGNSKNGLHDFERLRLGNPVEGIALYCLSLLDWKNTVFPEFEADVARSYRKTIEDAVRKNPNLSYLKAKDFKTEFLKEKLKNSILIIGTKTERFYNSGKDEFKEKAITYAVESFRLVDGLKKMTKGLEREQYDQLGYLLADSLENSRYNFLQEIGKKFKPNYQRHVLN